jgi:hypothetical protein
MFALVISGVKARARFTFYFYINIAVVLYRNAKYNTNFSRKVGFLLTLSKFWMLRDANFKSCFFIQLLKNLLSFVERQIAVSRLNSICLPTFLLTNMSLPGKKATTRHILVTLKISI